MAYGLGGKVALVTGSTTGIGEATARCLAEVNVAIMVSGRSEERGLKLVDDIKAAGGKASFFKADLREAGVCEALVKATVAEFGKLDILVNNAGILYTANIVDTTEGQWLDTFAVNVTAVFLISRAAIAEMMKTGGGVIVNVASEWGLNGEPNHTAYCASKGALVQMTRCMALDLAQSNIRVNSVCPGEIHTQMVDDILASKGGDVAENLRALAGGIPVRRLASPREVGRVIRFLASEDASYVTGANLPVDGGNDATAGPYP
ncbi:MAG: glucose 1-dehydrogenase [Proteobacteria bacterium]|nr:glucose 1-dehydrogenase [Pseudomonadota bacterium]